jgi:hypothetical protein
MALGSELSPHEPKLSRRDPRVSFRTAVHLTPLMFQQATFKVSESYVSRPKEETAG